MSVIRPCDEVTTLYLNPGCEEALSLLSDALSVEGRSLSAVKYNVINVLSQLEVD